MWYISDSNIRTKNPFINNLKDKIIKFINSNILIIFQDIKFFRIVFDENRSIIYKDSNNLILYPNLMINQLHMCSLKSYKTLLYNIIIKHYFFLDDFNAHRRWIFTDVTNFLFWKLV